MKKYTLKHLTIAVITASSLAGITSTANACSRMITETDYGQQVVRTLDWGQKLGTTAEITVPGQTRNNREAVSEYQIAASWTAKYRTVNLVDYQIFDTAAEAINEKGLSALLLYMDSSKSFLTQHQDSGAPAVSLRNLTSYIAENFADTSEVKNAMESNQFQIAWKSPLHQGGELHGLHFSVQDKSGHIILVQLNEGGNVVVHDNANTGNQDLNVMTNEPLQQDHRKYVAQFDLNNINTAYDIPSSISSTDRNLRLLWNLKHQSWDGLTKAQTEGKLISTFDASALVPYSVIDPNYGGTYTTWVQYIYGLDTGEFKARNLETNSWISFSWEDIAGFENPMQADLMKQASNGKQKAEFTPL